MIPARLILNVLYVAIPLAFVETVFVPLSVPVPLASDTVTETPDEETGFPKKSETCTVIGGEMVVPAAALEGCWANNS